MAEHGVGPAPEHGRHPPSPPLDGCVPDGVHADVEAMKPSDRDAVLNGSATEPERYELPMGSDAVLPGGQRRQPALSTWVISCMTYMLEITQVCHGGEVGVPRRTGQGARASGLRHHVHGAATTSRETARGRKTGGLRQAVR